MKRLAIFVEGQTEVLFVERLLRQFVSPDRISVEHGKFKVGKAGGRRYFEIHVKAENNRTTEYFVAIYDCGSDEQVKTVINEQYDGLLNKGYSLIIGLRDAHPRYTRQQVKRNQELISFGIRHKPSLPVHYIVAIMEIEAWFIAEFTHFQRLHASLNVGRVSAILNRDVTCCCTEDIDTPADVLEEIYGYAKKQYGKRFENVSRTVDNISFEYLCFDAITRNPSLESFIKCIDSFFVSE